MAGEQEEGWDCYTEEDDIEEPLLNKVLLHDDEDDDEDIEELSLPDASQIPTAEISWPPRPNDPTFRDVYDRIKSFILRKHELELIFEPMDGNMRKIVHMMSELFELPSKSYGSKLRHVRVFKNPDDVPVSIHNNQGVGQRARIRADVPEQKLPLFVKEIPETVLSEVIIATDQEGNHLVKRIIKEAEEEDAQTPTQGHQVELHYDAYYLDGGVFDSSRYRKQEFKYNVGEGMVIVGWEIAITTMKVGEIAELVVPPNFAFGKWGCPPRIPANATLRYEIELLRFSAIVPENKNQEKAANKSVSECLAKAETARFEGNTLFRANSYRRATKCYNRARDHYLGLKNLSEEDEFLVNRDKVLINNNLAICYLKLQDYQRAKSCCEAVLKIEPTNSKALCRMGETLLNLKDVSGAKVHLLKVYENNKNDAKVTELLRIVKKREEEAKLREKEMFKGIFTSDNAQ